MAFHRRRNLGILLTVALCGIALRAIAQEEGPPRPPPLAFAGFSWLPTASRGPQGPGPNRFRAENVHLDALGRLVLEVRQDEGGWTCAEAFLDHSLGYGDYEVRLGGLEGPWDDRLVLGFFTWDSSPAYANRELDLELSRWGNASGPNLAFTVQPPGPRGERQALFEIDPSGGLVLRLRWTPKAVTFLAEADGRTLGWSFPDPREARTASFSVPPRGAARIGLNLWIFQGRWDSGRETRVVVEDFRFSPWRP